MERGLAANTLASYRRDLSRYQQVMTAAGRTEIGEVTSADIASYLAGLREGDADHPPLAASSAGRAMAAVRGLHAFACAQGITAADPARPVTPPAPPRRLPKAISVAEVERLLDAAGPGPHDDPRGIRDRALLEFLYATGARISEATALDVDGLTLDGLARDGRALDRQPAVLLDGKGGKQRIVPLGRYAAAALDAYLVRARPALAAGATRTVPPAVFLNARGGRLTRQGAWAVLRRAARAGQSAPGVPAYPPAFLCHAHARWRRRYPGRAGTARTCVGDHHADLHPGHRGETARGVRGGPPAGAGISAPGAGIRPTPGRWDKARPGTEAAALFSYPVLSGASA